MTELTSELKELVLAKVDSNLFRMGFGEYNVRSDGEVLNENISMCVIGAILLGHGYEYGHDGYAATAAEMIGVDADDTRALESGYECADHFRQDSNPEWYAFGADIRELVQGEHGTGGWTADADFDRACDCDRCNQYEAEGAI